MGPAEHRRWPFFQNHRTSLLVYQLDLAMRLRLDAFHADDAHMRKRIENVNPNLSIFLVECQIWVNLSQTFFRILFQPPVLGWAIWIWGLKNRGHKWVKIGQKIVKGTVLI